jgi:putative membrane protein
MSHALEPDRVYTEDELEAVLAIECPHRNLLRYYALTQAALLLLCAPALVVPFTTLLLYFRYHTLRYRFDAEGVRMSWGILFRREVVLAYARIQDIHLSSNIVERWLGLAKIEISTASGSAHAEMTLEGLQEFARVRDFLYSRMRGAAADHRKAPTPAGDALALVDALRQVSDDLRAVRAALEARRPQ